MRRYDSYYLRSRDGQIIVNSTTELMEYICLYVRDRLVMLTEHMDSDKGKRWRSRSWEVLEVVRRLEGAVDELGHRLESSRMWSGRKLWGMWRRG